MCAIENSHDAILPNLVEAIPKFIHRELTLAGLVNLKKPVDSNCYDESSGGVNDVFHEFLLNSEQLSYLIYSRDQMLPKRQQRCIV